MGDIAVRVENLSKEYRIGGKQERYKTLRDTLTDAVADPFRRAGQLVRGQAYAAGNLNETIWALKEVSFEVKKGEVVGIIGRNGAGKSTLLKILSRITEPTSGYIEVFGRVGALLEVGTGFHPELTGRENIYLNGAILGMSRKEINRKFDEIVEFAEIEKFIDTPVKHYSSGMGLRLGFAVAAHLEPEILVVDEVLAVGDAEFQKKCLGKMSDVASEGRTVLFVSHNMGAVQSLCEQGLLLHQGVKELHGTVSEVIQRYIARTDTGNTRAKFALDNQKQLQILEVWLQPSSELAGNVFELGEFIYIEVVYCVNEITAGSNIALLLKRNATDVSLSFDTDSNPTMLSGRLPGLNRYTITLPTAYLKAGFYTIDISTGVINKSPIEIHREVLSFRIVETSQDTTHRGDAEHRPGIVKLPVQWQQTEQENV